MTATTEIARRTPADTDVVDGDCTENATPVVLPLWAVAAACALVVAGVGWIAHQHGEQVWQYGFATAAVVLLALSVWAGLTRRPT
jgi:hypothetical protein